MLASFFKIAVRHLKRNKALGFINLAGLTLGMTCALLAILFVRDEMSYDRFHDKAARLYRLNSIIIHTNDGTQQILGTTGQVEGPAFKNAIPEIAGYVRVLGTNGINLTGNGKSIAVSNLYAESSFFHLFTFPLLSGDPKAALVNPQSVVLSETTARKFFGSTDVVGKLVKIEEGRGMEDLLVTGVAKDPPTNSSIQFDIVLPFSYLQKMFTDDNWLDQYLSTFLLLNPDANVSVVEKKLAEVFARNAKDQLAGSKLSADHYRFGLEPFTDIHLKPLASTKNGGADEEMGLSGASSLTYSYILSGIIGFILLMACVNFINLTIADSMRRSKEIGVRKIIGGDRTSIVLQFLTEAALICIAAYLLAILSAKLLLPVFDRLSGKHLTLSLTENAGFYVDGLLLLLVCIGVAGLYPAIVVSAVNPVRSLAGSQKLNGKNYFGKGLIVLQFTLAIGLVIASCVYYRQMNFISSKDLGYDPHDILQIHLPPQRANAGVIRSFRNALLSNPAADGVASMMDRGMGSVIASGKDMLVRTNSIDEHFLSTLKISLKSGRNFYAGSSADSLGSVIVNESFEKAAGWKDAVGHQLVDLNDSLSRTIIGVVRDYHYGSLKEDIQPEILIFRNTENILVKVQPGKDIQAVSAISATFRTLFPDHFFEYQFLDDANSSWYKTDQQWEQIILYATGIALVICCIGLFGLSVFAAQNRIKEIGIRKVLGASVVGIVALLTKGFLRLVILAIGIASPLAWMVMNRWLETFAYKVDIGWWVFALSAFLSIAIAAIAISFQTIRAALANPVKSLRAG